LQKTETAAADIQYVSGKNRHERHVRHAEDAVETGQTDEGLKRLIAANEVHAVCHLLQHATGRSRGGFMLQTDEQPEDDRAERETEPPAGGNGWRLVVGDKGD
jgi:hypothetical protein